MGARLAREAGSAGERRPPSIGIIGCGFGGIAMAVKLKKAGISNFVIFEAADGPGGTWWLNTYPGCEVDVPSDMYSFSFSSYPWSRNYARQPELAAYIQKIIAEYGFEEHIRFNSRVTAIHWSDSSHQYELTTEDGSTSRFEVVV